MHSSVLNLYGKSSKANQPLSTIDQILGNARNTLQHSRQFRTPSSVTGKKSRVTIAPEVPATPDEPNANNEESGENNTLPKPIIINRSDGLFDPTGAFPLVSSSTRIKPSITFKRPEATSDSSSDETSDHDSDSPASEPELHQKDLFYNTSDNSTVTPPTITESKSSKRSSRSKRSLQLQLPEDIPNTSATTVGNSRESKQHANRKSKTKQSELEKTLLLRGDPISEESYKIMKEMTEDDYDNSTKSYTDDFTMDRYGSSAEVPKTEKSLSSGTERTFSFATDKANSSSPPTESFTHVQSSLVEISENLKDLTMSLSDTDFRQKSSEEQVNKGEKFKEISSHQEEENSKISENVTADPSKISVSMEGERKGSSRSSTKAASKDSKKTSATSSHKTPRSGSLPAKRDEESLKSTKVTHTTVDKRGVNASKTNKTKFSKSVNDSSKDKTEFQTPKHVQQQRMLELVAATTSNVHLSKMSSRQGLRHLLSHIALDKEEEIEGAAATTAATDGENQGYVLPKTKPQANIELILRQEIYEKELRRLRRLYRRTEKERMMVALERLKNYRKVKAMEQGLEFDEEEEDDAQEGGKVVLHGNSNGRRKKSGKLSEIQEKDLGYSVHLNEGDEEGPEDEEVDKLADDDDDDSLGSDLESIPSGPNDPNDLSDMSVDRLVKEVMESNERMYKMTINAAREMSREYGRKARLIRKLQKSRELYKSKEKRNK